MDHWTIERILAVLWGHNAPPPSRVGVLFSRIARVAFSTVAGTMGFAFGSVPFTQLQLGIGPENRYAGALTFVVVAVGTLMGAIVGFRSSWNTIAIFAGCMLALILITINLMT